MVTFKYASAEGASDFFFTREPTIINNLRMQFDKPLRPHGVKTVCAPYRQFICAHGERLEFILFPVLCKCNFDDYR